MYLFLYLSFSSLIFYYSLFSGINSSLIVLLKRVLFFTIFCFLPSKASFRISLEVSFSSLEVWILYSSITVMLVSTLHHCSFSLSHFFSGFTRYIFWQCALVFYYQNTFFIIRSTSPFGLSQIQTFLISSWWHGSRLLEIKSCFPHIFFSLSFPLRYLLWNIYVLPSLSLSDFT